MPSKLIVSLIAGGALALAPASASAQLNLGGLVDTELTGTVGSVLGGGTEPVTGVLEGLTGQLTDPLGNLVGTVNALTGQVLDPDGLVIGLLGPGGQITPVAPGTVAPVGQPTPGGSTPEPATAVDRVAPIVRLFASGSARARSVARRGVRAQVRCSEACAVLTSLELDARTARALGLTRSRRPLVLAMRPVIVTESGVNRSVTLKPSRRVRRALGRTRRTVRLRLRAMAFDAFANQSRIVSRRVAVRR